MKPVKYAYDPYNRNLVCSQWILADIYERLEALKAFYLLLH
jgi:hypothetical protein